MRRGHDDLLVSAALCGVLDCEPWGGTGESVIIPARDVLYDPDWWGPDYPVDDLDDYGRAERRRRVKRMLLGSC